TYNPEVDRVPLLVVATALRGLIAGGRALWERYDNGDNLLFRESDLRDPARSALFQELRQLPDPVLQSLVGHLARSCQGKVGAAPLLEEMLPGEKPAGPVQPLAPAPPPTPAQAEVTATLSAAPKGDFCFSDTVPPTRLSRKKGRRSVGSWVAAGTA